MSSSDSPKHDLPLPPSALLTFDSEIEEELSIVAVTPRSSCSLANDVVADQDVSTRGVPPQEAALSSDTSTITTSLSTASSNTRRGTGVIHQISNAGPSSSMGSLFSRISKAWTSRGGKPEREEKKSPNSIMFDGWGGHGEKEMDEDEDSEDLKQPVFASIDGEDAREFQEFLEEHCGERHGMPVLCLVEFGTRGRYGWDVWVIMHNTIRRELFDVLEILKVVRREYLGLRMEDVREIRKWWRFFDVVMKAFGEHEAEKIRPVVERLCEVDGRREMLRREMRELREMNEWIELKMEEITSYIEEFEMLKPGRALSLICKNVDTLAARCTRWFAKTERVLPGLIQDYYGDEIRVEIIGALIKRLRGMKGFAELIVAVTRWMGSGEGVEGRKVRQIWMGEFLFWGERQSMDYYQGQFDAVHGNVVGYFRERLHNSDSL